MIPLIDSLVINLDEWCFSSSCVLSYSNYSLKTLPKWGGGGWGGGGGGGYSHIKDTDACCLTQGVINC